MKRRTLNSKGAGFSQAFQDAAAEPPKVCYGCRKPIDGPVVWLGTDANPGGAVTSYPFHYKCADQPWPMFQWYEMKPGDLGPAVPVCDRSGDVGSTHYWPDGAQVGDWCRCGKRKKFPKL